MRKRFLPLTTIAVFLAAAPACHRNVPHIAKPPIATAPPPVAPVAIPAKAKITGPLAPIALPDLNTGQINSLRFSPDGRRLVFGYGTDAEVAAWNLETGRFEWLRHVNAAGGGSLNFTPNGRFLIAQFTDPDGDTPIIICRPDGHLIRHLPSFQDGGTARLEKKARYLVIGGNQDRREADHMHWNVAQLTEVLDTHSWNLVDYSSKAPVDPAGFVPLTSSGKILQNLSLQHTLKPHNAGDKSLAAQFSNLLIFGYTDAHGEYTAGVRGDGGSHGEVEVWNMPLKKRLWKVTLKEDSPRAPAISPDGQMLAVGTLQGNIYFWELKTGRVLAKTHCASDVLRSLAYSTNGRVLAAAGGMYDSNPTMNDGIRLLDTVNHKVFAVLKVSSAGDRYMITKTDWTLQHPDWFAVLPDLSYVASDSVVRKIRMPGKPREAAVIRKFERPRRVRAALRKCYSPG